MTQAMEDWQKVHQIFDPIEPAPSLREEVLPAYQALGDTQAHDRVLRALGTITAYLPDR